MEITPEIRALINRSAPEEELRETALSQGFQPLLADGLDKVQNGLVSLEEVLRVCKNGLTRVDFQLSYEDESKKGLQRLEIVALVILVPMALYGVYFTQQSWKVYREAEALLKSGQYLLHNEEYAAAADEFLRAVEKYPEAVCRLVRPGGLPTPAGRARIWSSKLIGVALTHLPDVPELHRAMAETYHELEEYDREIEQLEKLRPLIPESGTLVDRLVKTR